MVNIKSTNILDPAAYSRLAAQWKSTAQNISGDSVVQNDLLQAAKAVTSDDLTTVRDTLKSLNLGNRLYRKEVSASIWELSNLMLQLDEEKSDLTFKRLYEADQKIIKHKGDVPEELFEKAKERFLTCLPEAYDRGTQMTCFYLSNLANLYKPALYFNDQDEALIENEFLEFINDFSERQKSGQTVPHDETYTFTMIIDAAMTRSASTPFRQRAHDIRKNEMADYMANNPGIKGVMGHAPALASSLDPER